jgi:hypothetical protein
MRLGHFEELNGSDIVLLSCDRAEIGALRASLLQGNSRASAVAIHDLAIVSDRHPARLFVCPKSATVDANSRDFIWRLSDNEYSDVDAKLEALKHVLEGHQYFPLQRSLTELMVSVGEYSDEWWQHYA